MENQMKDYLLKHKNKKISLSQLERALSKVEYQKFAELILKLERQQILYRVHKSGENQRTPRLANSYTINKPQLLYNLRATIARAQKKLELSMDLDIYLNKSIERWKVDLPYLEQLNTYIARHGFPKHRALVNQRSYEIFKNEKFISEEGGKALLEGVKVWDDLRIWPVVNPVSFALNPHTKAQAEHIHLIVESKEVYYSLIPLLENSQFTSILYGDGKSILSTIDIFPQQLPLPNAKHMFYYFGNLDYSGIEIWYLLSQKISIRPATEFYEACLKQSMSLGKTYQRKNKVAMDAFLKYFSGENQQAIKRIFEYGGYFPQEKLKINELERIWHEVDWEMNSELEFKH